MMTQANMTALLEKQQQAYKNDLYPDLSIRLDRLDRIVDMLLRHKESVCDAAMADFDCRSAMSTKVSDILSVIEGCKYARKHLPRWMKAQGRKSKFPLSLLGAKSHVVYQPLGVVGNISAWNFPIQLTLAPLADIFAAGNLAMLKPSELSENTSKLIAEMVRENFAEEELTTILGEADVAAQFSALPFDHLLFTGSTHVGKMVAQAAAANLVPVTLELGGKNPVVVSQTADIDLAAEKIIWAKTLNGGQLCLSPDTVLVHQDRVHEFIQSCQKSASKMYSSFADDIDYTHVINDRHAQRLRSMVDEAQSDGAKVITLGEGSQRCVAPTLILEPKMTSRVMTEEIFGGPLSVMAYSDIQQAIEFINDRPKPLALYYFGSDKTEADRITQQTSSGGMVINDCLAHHIQEDLPFGGVGDSGMGAYHGFDGFKNFSHARAVFTQSRFDPLRLIRPPYGNAIRSYVDKQIKS